MEESRESISGFDKTDASLPKSIAPLAATPSHLGGCPLLNMPSEGPESD